MEGCIEDDLNRSWAEALGVLEAKSRDGKCTQEEHRLILFYRYSLQLIPSHHYWLTEV